MRARRNQLPIACNDGVLGVLRPRTLLVMGGRGAGKTRTGAEFVHAAVHGLPPFWQGRAARRIALVGETYGDGREVMVEGPSGILRLYPANGSRGRQPEYEAARRRLVWDNGAVAYLFSSEEPEALRGPQFDAAWCDEAAKWRNAVATFDMLQFGLRLGDAPRQIVTTTPRPTPLMKRLLAEAGTAVMRMKTADNAANLAKSFLAEVEGRYGGSTLGRQELDGEMIAERDGALWSREMIEACIADHVPPMRRIVVAVDPPATARRTSDACGIVAVGLDGAGRAVVLADESIGAARPLDWANRAVGLYHRLQADCLLAEVNQGGDMVAAVIRSVDSGVPVKAVRATRHKWTRAEPVATLYAQGKVAHAGRFRALEDEMCDFDRNGLSGGRSPDRVDALVWAVTELIGTERAEPRVRVI